jgi:hypothetical protein
MKRLEESLQDWERGAPILERFIHKEACEAILACAQSDAESLRLRNLSSLPSGLGTLEHLRELDLSFNPIGELPPDIVDLPNLRILNLDYCRLEALPDNIGRLGRLEQLQLKSNWSLKSLPGSLGNIDTLDTIDVTGCSGLESFPASIDLYKVKVQSERTPLVLYPPFREAHFDSQTRMELEKFAKLCKKRWNHLMTAFTPEQLCSAYERDALKRARLSSTVSQMALPGEEPTPGVTFETGSMRTP